MTIREMKIKRYDVNGSNSYYEDENGCFVDYQDYREIERENLNLKKLVRELNDKLNCGVSGDE